MCILKTISCLCSVWLNTVLVLESLVTCLLIESCFVNVRINVVECYNFDFLPCDLHGFNSIYTSPQSNSPKRSKSYLYFHKGLRAETEHKENKDNRAHWERVNLGWCNPNRFEGTYIAIWIPLVHEILYLKTSFKTSTFIWWLCY